MGIDISALPLEMQGQALRKLGLDAGKAPQRPAKYHNVPATRQAEGGQKPLRFDSQKEARVFDELMILLMAGEVRDVKLQPEFTLTEAYTLPNGNRVRATRYRADFSYIDRDGKLVVVDVKSPATKTRVYELKKKLLRERWGIEVVEV